uniref:NADH dehydrogenase subunit 4 n=1 Tax=Anagyrus galinae TaxID=3085291 RepID=UPI002A7F6BA8|nr:NADH dehydrogenase subunit 4 [Anagyrus galinae]WON65603.1 NADH dehydrogenase subunit 4 [Anagyrus galinae]
MMKMLLFIFMLMIFFMKKKMCVFLSNLLLLFTLLMLMFTNLNNYWMKIYGNLGMDKISFILILLVLWIFSLVFLVKMKNMNFEYLFNLLFLMFILLMCFSWINMFMFYLFFEISLIPIFLLILGWGYQAERIKASYYMLFYTLFFSLPLLILLFLLNFLNKSLNFIFFFEMNMMSFWSLMIYFFLFMAFMVKLPIFLFHNWLPKAHVEAPLVGSMILAAIMLKLGGYGIFRLLNLMNINFVKMNDLFISLSVIGMIVLSMLCLRHYDLKVIVAYSSVVHMGMMLMGFMIMKLWGFYGSLFMMISHGICSSSMFYMVNLFYERSKSRNLLINKGLVYFIPSMMLFWFLLCMNNMASPISLNLLSEIMIILTLMNWSMKIILFLILGMFFSAAYNLYIFSYSFHGIYNFKLIKFFNNSILEYYMVIFHFIPLNLLILKINMII